MGMTSKIRTLADELVPLAQRIRYMRIFRVSLGAAVVAFAAFAPDVVGAGPLALATGAIAWVVTSFAAEGLWRLLKTRGLFLFGAMLIIDGVFLAWMVYLTGGASSALLSLILLHLVAVTLMASYRTGLKLAMWHSILLLIVFYAQEAGMPVPGIPHPPGLTADSFHRLVGFIGVYWILALATSTFSAINERELRRRRYDLEALAKLATALEENRDGKGIAEGLMDSLQETFGFERGVVLGKRSDEVDVLASRGDLAHDGGPVVGADMTMRSAWESKHTVLVSRLDPMMNPTLSSLLPEARNLIVVPLMAEGGALGLVAVEQPARQGARVERRVVSMMERFCSHAALAIRNATLADQLRHMADVDPLTGIANRGTFERTLEKELARSSRSGEALGLVMLDIDHFKQLNDTYGHRTGDEVLRLMTTVLSTQLRTFDTAARYGGEEFGIVLPGADKDTAVMVAERLRAAVSQMPSSTPVTVSAGVATFPMHAADAESLVKAADAAMYRSKHAGRDRVTCAGTTVADEGEAWVHDQLSDGGRS
jgi:diguanylate cyclase (GGDEF)-like protein